MSRILSGKIVILSLVTCVVSGGMVQAAETSFLASQGDTIADVSLQTAGTLVGQVVDAQGQAVPEASVSIYRDGVEIAVAITSDQGVFTASGLQGGIYTLVVDGRPTNFRVWSEGAAPPSANPAALIVADGSAVRSQFGGGGGNIGLYAALGGATFFVIQAVTSASGS